MGLKERREREREDRRRQILDVARTLLFEKGLRETSINRIARRAELGVGTLYFYFRNKEEIFAALQQEGLERLCGAIDSALTGISDPADKLRAAAGAMLRFSREQRQYLDVINCFLATPEVLFAPSIKIEVDRYGARIIERIADVVQEGQTGGRFDACIDAHRFAILFVGAVHGLVQYRKLESTVLQGAAFDQVFADAVDHLVASLMTVSRQE